MYTRLAIYQTSLRCMKEASNLSSLALGTRLRGEYISRSRCLINFDRLRLRISPRQTNIPKMNSIMAYYTSRPSNLLSKIFNRLIEVLPVQFKAYKIVRIWYTLKGKYIGKKLWKWNWNCGILHTLLFSRLNVHILRSIYLHVLRNGSTLDMIIFQKYAKKQNDTANSQEVIEEERSINELMIRMELYDRQ